MTPPRIKLDWKRYFEDFCALHGDPINLNPGEQGLLLFPDGWRYSNYRYDGEEIAPANPSEAITLQLLYWETRRKQVERDLKIIQSQYDYFDRNVHGRSLPLYRKIAYLDSDGVRRTNSEPIDLDDLTHEIDSLSAKLSECSTKVNELCKATVEQGNQS